MERVGCIAMALVGIGCISVTPFLIVDTEVALLRPASPWVRRVQGVGRSLREAGHGLRELGQLGRRGVE